MNNPKHSLTGIITPRMGEAQKGSSKSILTNATFWGDPRDIEERSTIIDRIDRLLGKRILCITNGNWESGLLVDLYRNVKNELIASRGRIQKISVMDIVGMTVDELLRIENFVKNNPKGK